MKEQIAAQMCRNNNAFLTIFHIIESPFQAIKSPKDFYNYSEPKNPKTKNKTKLEIKMLQMKNTNFKII